MPDQPPFSSTLPFNPYAFVQPETPAEFSALLEEAVRMAGQLGDQVDGIGDWLAANATPRRGSRPG